MNLLEPDWNQEKPSYPEVLRQIASIKLRPLEISEPILIEFLEKLRQQRNFGGAHLFGFEADPNDIFDWYTSRNRWSFDGLIDALMVHPAIRLSADILKIPDTVTTGFSSADPFLLDGHFAGLLYGGGAYTRCKGDGKEEKEFALAICNALFGGRYGEISMDESGAAWTPWFMGIAWDVSIVIFDKRLRRIWLFVATDTD